jgi:hypothetical protein
MVGVARRLDVGEITDAKKLAEAYNSLLVNPNYAKVISQSTADESSVKTRLDEAVAAFRGIK